MIRGWRINSEMIDAAPSSNSLNALGSRWRLLWECRTKATCCVKRSNCTDKCSCWILRFSLDNWSLFLLVDDDDIWCNGLRSDWKLVSFLYTKSRLIVACFSLTIIMMVTWLPTRRRKELYAERACGACFVGRVYGTRGLLTRSFTSPKGQGP